MCGVGNVTLTTEHFVVEFTEDREIVGGFHVPNFEDFVVGVHVHFGWKGCFVFHDSNMAQIRVFYCIGCYRFRD